MRKQAAVFMVLLFVSLAVAVFAGPGKQKAPAKKAAPITNTLGMKLVPIPAGEFLMGSGETIPHLQKTFPAGYNMSAKLDLFEDELPRHRVRITRPFYLGSCEVTVGQFRKFIEDSGYRSEPERDGTGGWGVNARTGKFEGRKREYSWQNPGFPQTDTHPVVNVTWNDAVAFCRWLSRKENKTYRLPTEAEWEYACRAGTTTRYFCGDDPETLVRFANIADASGAAKGKLQFRDWDKLALAGRDGHTYTAPVGSFKPNAWGLYDMHGNVWEWCSDRYGEDYYPKSPRDDPQGPATGHLRVRRGGAWHTFPLYVRSAFRNYNTPVSRYLNLGFRVARSD
jgi:sulfatase modifying factor 1